MTARDIHIGLNSGSDFHFTGGGYKKRFITKTVPDYTDVQAFVLNGYAGYVTRKMRRGP